MEQINDLKTKLDEVQKLLSLTETAEARHEQVSGQLKAVEAKLAEVRKELESTTVGLTEAQVKAGKEHDQKVFTALKELREIEDRIVVGRKELADLTSKCNSAKTLHDQVQASIDSLRKMLGVR